MLPARYREAADANEIEHGDECCRRGEKHRLQPRRRRFVQRIVPNAVKNMPNKSIQLTTYDVLKKFIARSEVAYEAEKKAYLKDLKMKRV